MFVFVEVAVLNGARVGRLKHMKRVCPVDVFALVARCACAQVSQRVNTIK